MQLLIHPLIQYALLAVVLAVCLYLFLVTRKEQMLDARVAKAEAAQLRSSLEVLRRQVAQLERRLCATEERVEEPPVVSQSMPGPGMNLTRRSQVLRMARRGDDVDRIAAELGLAASEVELLLKVHKILDAQPEATGKR